MKPTTALAALNAIAALSLTPVNGVAAQEVQLRTSFVHLGQGEPAALYEPASPGSKSQIGIFVMHSGGDYLNFSACTQLAQRGYRVLCANNSTSKSGEFNDGILDRVLLQVKAGVIYLHGYPGVKKVILWGHSGGATLMTAYQDIAENGVRACQDAAKIHRCPDSLAAMPAADGVILADPNWGLAAVTLMGIDPAVSSNDSGMTLNADLDMFNPNNGFKATGSTYSPAFVHRFLSAQGRRNNALVKLAQQRLAAIEAGKGHFSDDEPFIIAGASFTENKLYAQDLRLMSHTQQAWPLIHADGSITTQVIHSVRVPELTENPSHTYLGAALKTTVRSYLNTYAIRVTDDYGYDQDSVGGIEWTSTYASNPGNAEGISAPFLALGMTGHFEGASAETIYNHARSADKTLAYVEGATHGYGTCKPCETTPGQFGDTMKTLYDYVDGWLVKDGRFVSAASAITP